MRRFLAHSISVARSAAGRKRYGRGSEFAMCRSISAFDGSTPSGPRPKEWSCCRALAWKVRARTPSIPSRPSLARISPAALSVNVTARISGAANVPVATCHAMRRVIVVVLPDPAPARITTGPRTASTARRCSAFSPSNTASPSTRPTLVSVRDDAARIHARNAPERASDVCLCDLGRRLGTQRRRAAKHEPAQARDHLERLAVPYQAFQVDELGLELRRVGAGALHAQDLRVHGRSDGLLGPPQLLVQLLARPRADEL